jgi:hypothetical protein
MTNEVLRAMRRRVTLSRVIRGVILCAFLGAAIWSMSLPRETGDRNMLILACGLVALWIVMAIDAARVLRDVQAGTILLGAGQLDDAEVWLRRALSRFSLSVRGQLAAAEQMAALLFRREAHDDVVAVCREILRHPSRRLRSLRFKSRIMLTDSLLLLDRVDEAYQAVRPLYDAPLTLAERMRLLPVQLRYELAADHARSSISDISEKVRIAELLESPTAALVHALLAEACRRCGMVLEETFLARRARLYHDLEDLSDRYPQIKPIAASSGL